MQNDPESRRSPSPLRTPSDSPVRMDSSIVRPREERTTPSATSWSPGSTRTTSPGTTSSSLSSRYCPSRITWALGATSSASWSSVSFAFSSWRIPIAELTTAISPNRASANSPSASMITKKTARIALKSVKTLPATMLATERLVAGSGSPSRLRRAAASALLRPCACEAASTPPIYTGAQRLPSAVHRHIAAAARIASACKLSGDGSKGDVGQAEALSVAFQKATKVYPGADHPAVNELDVEVQAGEICVFVGPSGCGKTTAMRMVNRMVEITEGDIVVGGTSVRERSPSDLRREIGYVIQQTGLFPHRTIAQNIATVPGLLGWDGDRVEARVRTLMESDLARPRSRGPLSGAALGRPAAASRGGPCARRGPRRDAHGRAVRRRRSHQP